MTFKLLVTSEFEKDLHKLDNVHQCVNSKIMTLMPSETEKTDPHFQKVEIILSQKFVLNSFETLLMTFLFQT
jgi:mRNA-degrading endonuclease RelE of RelBE toxin-antitoxin system